MSDIAPATDDEVTEIERFVVKHRPADLRETSALIARIRADAEKIAAAAGTLAKACEEIETADAEIGRLRAELAKRDDALREAPEHVRHAPRCPGIIYADEFCTCGAVAYLDRASALLGVVHAKG